MPSSQDERLCFASVRSASQSRPRSPRDVLQTCAAYPNTALFLPGT
jgi:hypothetical protein